MTDNPGYLPDIELPPPDEITPEIARATIQNDLPNAINAGLSANAALAMYKDYGIGINRQQFLGLYRQARAELDSGPDYLSLPLEAEVNNFDREVLPWESRYQYMSQVRVSLYDVETGEVIQKLHAVYHDEPLTIGEILEAAQSFYLEGGQGGSSGKLTLSATLDRAYRNRELL